MQAFELFFPYGKLKYNIIYKVISGKAGELWENKGERHFLTEVNVL